jgi:hypothetical protein
MFFQCTTHTSKTLQNDFPRFKLLLHVKPAVKLLKYTILQNKSSHIQPIQQKYLFCLYEYDIWAFTPTYFRLRYLSLDARHQLSFFNVSTISGSTTISKKSPLHCNVERQADFTPIKNRKLFLKKSHFSKKTIVSYLCK